MTAPEQHAPPVYACAAGAVLHRHAADTLEPAVLLHTFLPPSVADLLDAVALRVDVHGNGPGTATVTVRVLSEGTALSWELPVAPFVAALPGQPGNDGRMVLLAVVDGEPEPDFWAQPVDCDGLAGELQLPVADLVDALGGRLTPWLVDDLQMLLHDDAHERAVDRSPAQTLATAVLAHYRGDLAATQTASQLVQALQLAPEAFTAELGTRLCTALLEAVEGAEPAAVAAVLGQTGPFEVEGFRLLTDLPAALVAVAPDQRPATVMQLLLDGQDRDDTVRAAVSVLARLARQRFGADLADEELLRRLGMVDDAGLVRIARLWVDLAGAAAAPAAQDAATAAELATRVLAEGGPGTSWLRDTAVSLALAAAPPGQRPDSRIDASVETVSRLLTGHADPGSLPAAAGTVQACLSLARFVRARAAIGPGRWLQAPVPAAAQALTAALLEGMDREVAVDLLAELLADDVEGPELLDGFVCATAQLLVNIDPRKDAALRRSELSALLTAVPAGPRGAQWLLVACLREAPAHDPAAADLSALLPTAGSVDVERAAARSGRTGLLRAGLQCLDALAEALGDEAHMPRSELVGLVLPSALAEHELLRMPEPGTG